MVMSLWEHGIAGHFLLWVSVCGTTVQKNLRGFRVPSEWKCLFSSHLQSTFKVMSLWHFPALKKRRKKNHVRAAKHLLFNLVKREMAEKMGQIFLEMMGWWAWEGRWHVTMAISGFLSWSENGALAGFYSGFVFPGVAVFVIWEMPRDQVRFTPWACTCSVVLVSKAVGGSFVLEQACERAYFGELVIKCFFDLGLDRRPHFFVLNSFHMMFSMIRIKIRRCDKRGSTTNPKHFILFECCFFINLRTQVLPLPQKHSPTKQRLC